MEPRGHVHTYGQLVSPGLVSASLPKLLVFAVAPRATSTQCNFRRQPGASSNVDQPSDNVSGHSSIATKARNATEIRLRFNKGIFCEKIVAPTQTAEYYTRPMPVPANAPIELHMPSTPVRPHCFAFYLRRHDNHEFVQSLAPICPLVALSLHRCTDLPH